MIGTRESRLTAVRDGILENSPSLRTIHRSLNTRKSEEKLSEIIPRTTSAHFQVSSEARPSGPGNEIPRKKIVSVNKVQLNYNSKLASAARAAPFDRTPDRDIIEIEYRMPQITESGDFPDSSSMHTITKKISAPLR